MFLTVRKLMKSCVFIKPMSFTSFTKILVFLLLHKIYIVHVYTCTCTCTFTCTSICTCTTIAHAHV